MATVPPFDVETDEILRNPIGFATQVKKAFQDLAALLINLSPLDNFSSFVWEGTIPASSEVRVLNRMKTVPRGYLVIFSQGGIVQAGTTTWTKDYVYLANVSAASAAVGRVVIFV